MTAILALSLLAQQGTRVGYIDLQVIMDNYKELAEAKDELDRYRAQWELKADSLKAQLDSLRRDYEEKRPMLTDQERISREMEIDEKEAEYNKVLRDMVAALEQKSQELLTPYTDKITATVRKISKELGLEMVLDISQKTLVYADPKKDITGLVLGELNKEYVSGGPIQKRKLLIFPLKELTEEAKSSSLGTTIQDAMSSVFERSPRFDVVPNGQVNTSLSAQNITTETISVDDAKRVTTDMGGNIFIYGTVRKTGEDAEFEVGIYLDDGTLIQKANRRARVSGLTLTTEAQNLANTLLNYYINWLQRQEETKGRGK
ncbi:MAG: OmpH family outer membrane protein [candidate division WOR-3 bacterium]